MFRFYNEIVAPAFRLPFILKADAQYWGSVAGKWAVVGGVAAFFAVQPTKEMLFGSGQKK